MAGAHPRHHGANPRTREATVWATAAVERRAREWQGSRLSAQRGRSIRVTHPVPAMSLARVTVATALRRLDVALPEHLPVAELLPELLRHAGEGLADDGER